MTTARRPAAGLRLGQFFAVVLIAGLCLGLPVLAQVAYRTASPTSLPAGYAVVACVGQTAPAAAGQLPPLGLWWRPLSPDLPQMAFAPPGWHACGLLPWAPVLPQNGRLP